MRLRIRLVPCVALVAVALGPRPASAGSPELGRGIDFLYSVEDPSGAFSLGRGDLALRDTAEVVAALNTLGMASDPRTQRAASLLRIAATSTADTSARVIRALRTDSLIDLSAANLLVAQQPDGGFALAAGFARGDVLDTALVLLALEPELRRRPAALYQALAFLSLAQQPSGGFGPDDGAPDVATTAEATRAIARYRDVFDVGVQLGAAQAFLARAQKSDGSFDTVRDTALAGLAFIESGQDPASSAIRLAITALEAAQESSGGFGNADPEVTALALSVVRYSLPNLHLDASDVTFSTFEPAQGARVTVTVTVHNTGADTAPASLVRLYRGETTTGLAAGETVAPQLAPGASAQVQLTWDTTGLLGTQILTVAVNADGKVIESRSDDNTERYVLTVRPHQALDLAITPNDVSFDPERPLAGQPTTLSAVVHNLGDDPAGAFVVRFYDGDPSAGAPLLAEAAASGVPPSGSVTVSVGPFGFQPPPHAIHVAVNPTGSVAESNLGNNNATKSLVVADDIDFVVTSDALSFTPSSTVRQGQNVTVGVRLLNAGHKTAHNAVVRLYRGAPDEHQPIGDLAYGDLAGGQAKTATFSYAVGNDTGIRLLYAVADPDQLVDELSERNNTGVAPLDVTAGANAFFVTSRVLGGGQSTEGDAVQLGYTFGNDGDLPLPAVDLRFFDGDPAQGGKRLGDLITNLPAPDPPGIPFVREVVFTVVTAGFSAGTHTIYAVADPDNLLVERSKADNAGTAAFDTRLQPDPGIAAQDIVVSPAAPEQGDRVTVNATFRDFNGATSSLSTTPHVLLYLGDPASGGRVLAEATAKFFPSAYAPTTLTATIDTSALTGMQHLVCLVDPEHTQRDGNRANNRADAFFPVNPDTRPDLVLGRADLLTLPSLVAADSNVTLRADVRNTRTVAASGVHVVFYDGDPATGGPAIGDTTIDVPAKGDAVASATLDTHGLLGDYVAFVRVDPNNLIPEADKTNNEAAIPFEIRHPVATAPTNLVASLQGSTVNLTWTAGSLNPQKGSLAFRGDTALVGSTVDVAASATASATSSYPYRTPSFANDGDPGTVWYPASSDAQPQLTLALARKEYVAEVDVHWDAVYAPYVLEAWDGVAYKQVAAGTAHAYSTDKIVLGTPTKTRRLRLSAGGTGIAEVNLLAVADTSATSSADPNRPAGDYTYLVTAVDPDGIESMPAAAPATIGLPPSGGNFAAAVAANDVTLTWTPSSDATAAGALLRRDGHPLNDAFEVTPTGTTNASSSSSSYYTADAANDDNLGTFWNSGPGDAQPWWEVDFPRPRLISRIDLSWRDGTNYATDFDLQTWDGSSWVTRLAVRNHLVQTTSTERFPLPDAFFTDRVRFSTVKLAGDNIALTEIDVDEVLPIPPGTASYVDKSLRTGSYAYTLTTLNAFAQEGSAASTTAVVLPPSAPTNLVAAPSGADVTLTFTSGGEANLAGTLLWRDGLLINPPSARSLSSRASVSVSTNPLHGVFVNDGNNGYPGVTIPGATGATVELVFPRPELVREIKLYLNTFGAPSYTVQTFDGSGYVTQGVASKIGYNYPNDFVLAQAVHTTRVRVTFPAYFLDQQLYEVAVFGPTPAAGASYTDKAPPEGTHRYRASSFTVLDDEGPLSAPATLKTGAVESPQLLVAQVVGTDVHLAWSPSPEASAAGYRVYRDFSLVSGNTLVPVSTPTFVDPLRPTGSYVYYVTTVDNAGGETASSNEVTAVVQVTTPPAPPQNPRVVLEAGRLELFWDASATADVIGYNIYKELAATPVNGAAPVDATTYYPGDNLNFYEDYVRGQPRYTYQVSAVDSSGLESARTASVVGTVALPTAPANVRATVANTDVTLTSDGSTGVPDISLYRFFRDGAPIPGPRFGLNASASSTLAYANYNVATVLDNRDDSMWLSDNDSYPVTVDITQTPPIPVDRLRIYFPDLTHLGTDFDVDAQTFDGFVPFARVRGNAQQEVILVGPNPPPITGHVRLTFLAGVGHAVAVGDVRLQGAADGYYATYVDKGISGGAHEYVEQAENRSGVFSSKSAAATPSVPTVDLSIGPRDIHFSSDTVAVGDTIGISATVHSTGDKDTDPEVDLYNGDPAHGGVLLFAQTVHLPAGLTAEAFTSFTVPAGATNIYAVVDPHNLIPETDEGNNVTFRGLPFSLPYRTITFTPQAFLASIYTNNTHLLIRNSAGQILATPTGNRGDVLQIDHLPQDVYTVSGDQKFALVWTGIIQGSLAQPATGFYVLDPDNNSYAKEFFFQTATANPGYARVVIWGRDPGTIVTVSDAQTGALYAQSALGPAEHLDLTQFSAGYGTQTKLHVVADHPVAVVNYGDNGYPVPATTGKYTGTRFYAFVGNEFGSDLNVLSYQANTSYTITDLDTGLLYKQGTLDENGIVSFPQDVTKPHYYQVDASNTVGVTVRSYAHGSTYIEGSPLGDHGGTLIGTDFLDTLSAFTGFGTPFAIVFSYYDDTRVTVQEVASLPALPKSQLATFAKTLNNGDFFDFSPHLPSHDTDVFGQPGAQECSAGGCPAFLYRIKSNRPISSVSGIESGPGDGNGIGGPSPLLFGAANDPDISIVSSDIKLSPLQPAVGQTVSVTADVRNLGARAARDFYVEIWDNPPEQGGQLLHSEFVPEIVEGDDYFINTTWTALAGLHQITVIADSRNQVAESDETNNRAFVLAQTPSDLAIAASDLALSPASALARQPVTLTATVHNLGGRAVSAVPVALYLGDRSAGGMQLARQPVDLAPGAQATLGFTVDTTALKPGPYALHVIADPDNTVAESNENNNDASVTLTVRAPAHADLAVTSISASPSSTTTSADVAVTVAVDNYGAPLSGPAVLRLYDGDPGSGGLTIATRSVVIAGPQAVSFTWQGPRAIGSHTVVAVLDPDNQIVEETKTNNRGETTVVATPAAATLAVATDQVSYAAGAVAQLSATLGGTPSGATLTLEVRDSAGALVATPVDHQPAADGRATTPLPIAQLLAGSYQLAGRVESGGSVVVRATAAFSVTGDARAVAVLVTDRASYAPSDTAQLIGTVANGGSDAELDGLQLAFTVTDAQGRLIGQSSATVDVLLPGARVQRVAPIALSGHAATTATARLVVSSGASVLATTTATFQIAASAGVTGTVSASPLLVDRGQPVTIARTLTASGNLDASGNVVTSIVDPMSGSTLQTLSQPVTLPAGATASGSATFDTTPLAGRPYIALVDLVSSGGQRLFRGVTGFEVHVVDATPPTITITGVADAQCYAASVTPVVTATDDTVVAQLTITLDGQPFASGTPVSAEAAHVLIATAVDGSGNQAQTTVHFIVDKTPPAVAVAGVSDGEITAAASVTPTITSSDAHLTSTTLTLDGQPFVSGTVVAAQGAHTLVAGATDCAGNTTSVTVHFTLDRSPPTIALSGVADGQCSGAAVTPSFSASDDTAVTVNATLDGQPFVSGTAVSAEGTHALVVTARDAAGNSATIQVGFIIDLTPPTINVAGVVAAEITAANVTPTVSAADANLTGLTLTLDGQPFTSGVTVTTEGDHLLVAGATDCAGHTSTVQVAFAIDRTPPSVAVSGVADGQCTANPVTPVVTASDAHLATVTLTLDGQPFVSGTAVSAEGHHVLAASALDAAGNRTDRSVSFTIDRTAPTITVSGVTGGSYVNTSVTPVVTVTDANLASSTLTLDGNPFLSGTAVSAEGHHVLAVSAGDCAGNTSSSTVSFTIDVTPPTIALSGLNDGQCSEGPVTPVFSASDASPTTLSAALDGMMSFVSGTPIAAEGHHVLVVTAVDAAGNRATLTRSFTVDRTPPAVAISGVTDGLVTAANVTPTVAISDANLVSQRILLDGNPFVSGTPVTAEGDHLLVAGATDCAGHTTTVQVAFAIDRTPPSVAISGVADHQCTASTVTPVITVTDAHLASQTLTLNGAPFVSGTSVTADGSYQLAVSAVDRAGNRTDRAVSFILDHVAPTITPSGVVDGSYTNQNVTPVVTFSDPNLTQTSLLLDGNAFVNGTTVSAEGTHLLTANASDCAGNQATRRVTFTIDKTPPQVSLGGFADGQCGRSDVAPTATFSDAHLASTSLTLDGNPFVSGTAVHAEGKHQVVAGATDLATNQTTTKGSFTVDRTPPTVTISGVTDGLLTRATVTPTVSVSDANLASQTLTLDGQPFLSGTPVAGDGDHVLTAGASDCASQTTTVTVHFTIDKTPPAITLSGVADAQVYGHPVTPVYSAGDLHLASVSALLNGKPFASGTTVSATGSYVLVVTATDSAGNQAQQTVHFSLQMTGGTVDLHPSGLPRILIAVEGGESDDCEPDEDSGGDEPAHAGCTLAEPTFLESTLKSAGLRYAVALGRAQWLAALRSDTFDVVIYYRPAPTEGDGRRELNEAVTYGTGLLCIDDHPDADPTLAEAEGATKQGVIPSISSVKLAGALGTASVPAGGPALRFTLQGGAAAGTVTSGKSSFTVAVTHRLGRGHAVLLGWNTELHTSQPLADLYLRAITYVTPTAGELVAGGAADLDARVTSTGATSGPFLLAMDLDPQLTLLVADPAPTVSSPPSWSFSLPPGQSKDFATVLRLPDQTGTYAVITRLQAQTATGPVSLGSSEVDLQVSRSRAKLASDVQAALQSLVLKANDAAQRKQALASLAALPTAAKPAVAQATQAITLVLDAIDYTRAIQAADTTAIRIDEARLLRSWETRSLP